MGRDQRNPWVTQPEEPDDGDHTKPDEASEPEPRLTGPAHHQRGVTPPAPDDRLGAVVQDFPADLWIVGAHGGAAENTIAELVPGWRAANHAWPIVDGAPTQRAVLTARSHVSGLHGAQHAARQWASQHNYGVELLGLIVVADAPGRLPRPIRELIDIVAGGFPRVWRVPWVEDWRLGAPVDLATSPGAVHRMVNELSRLLHTQIDEEAN